MKPLPGIPGSPLFPSVFRERGSEIAGGNARTMKQTLICLLLGVLLLLPGCGKSNTQEDALQVAATTYPVYLLAQAVTDGVEGISLSLVINQQVSCLHDYTLTMQDMIAVERADVLLLNGAGLEEFLSDALEGRSVIDCSAGIALLEGEDGEVDPHIWMDPRNAAQMAETIAAGLAELDPEHAGCYLANAQAAAEELTRFYGEMLVLLGEGNYPLITFHDGFGYFARAFGLELLAAIEEEEGSEASAKTMVEIIRLVEAYDLPAIFTEANGSDATALAIGRECGTATLTLDICMSGSGGGLAAYEAVIRKNLETIWEAYA